MTDKRIPDLCVGVLDAKTGKVSHYRPLTAEPLAVNEFITFAQERDRNSIAASWITPEADYETKTTIVRDLCRSAGVSDMMIDQMLAKPLTGEELSGLPKRELSPEDLSVHRAIAAMKRSDR